MITPIAPATSNSAPASKPSGEPPVGGGRGGAASSLLELLAPELLELALLPAGTMPLSSLPAGPLSLSVLPSVLLCAVALELTVELLGGRLAGVVSLVNAVVPLTTVLPVGLDAAPLPGPCPSALAGGAAAVPGLAELVDHVGELDAWGTVGWIEGLAPIVAVGDGDPEPGAGTIGAHSPLG